MQVNLKFEDFFQIRVGKTLKVSSRLASKFTDQEGCVEKIVSFLD